jgi:tripartite-type tricarboxylate transporter receptor subunit TctC
MKECFLFVTVITIGFLFGSSGLAPAEDFYKGKTIRFIVGYGGHRSYDTYARAIARHIGKYVPGNPVTIVENLPSANSLTVANRLFNRVKPDGLTVGVWNSRFVLLDALGDDRIRFDPRRVGWIGAPSSESPACAVMGFTGLRTIEDIQSSYGPIRMGVISTAEMSSDLPIILDDTLGTNFQTITGFKETSDCVRAMRKKELDGMCLAWESMRRTAGGLLEAKGDNKLIPFLIDDFFEDPRVRDLPLIPNVIIGEENRATYETWATHLEFFRPLTVPPETPKDRLRLLREAFKATLNDPKFLAEAQKAELDIDYVSGEEVEKYVADIFAMSSNVRHNLELLVR